MPANPAEEADALAIAVPAAADPLAAAVLAGVVADGLPLLDDEALPQPAARPIRAASTAALTTAPIAVSFLFTWFLSARFSAAWRHELFT
jgi:hypothetical protein